MAKYGWFLFLAAILYVPLSLQWLMEAKASTPISKPPPAKVDPSFVGPPHFASEENFEQLSKRVDALETENAELKKSVAFDYPTAYTKLTLDYSLITRFF